MEKYQTVDTKQDRASRLAEFAAKDMERAEEEKKGKRANKDFIQVYGKGWRRLQSLIQDNPGAARIYAFLAEHIDGATGVVVVSQDVLASELDVHVITIKRQTKYLEEKGALVRIRIGGGVYGYALDPTEMWASWSGAKETAAFLTKTLVSKSDAANNLVDRRLRMMVAGNKKGEK